MTELARLFRDSQIQETVQIMQEAPSSMSEVVATKHKKDKHVPKYIQEQEASCSSSAVAISKQKHKRH